MKQYTVTGRASVGQEAKSTSTTLSVMGPLLGQWPTSDTELPSFQSWTGRLPAVYRHRGQDGTLDSALIKSDAMQFARAGGVLSLAVNPWIGRTVDGTRKAVPYADISSGKWDAKLESMAAEVGALPAGSRHVIEFSHEVDVVTPAQPFAGPAREFKAAYAHVRGVFQGAGARDLVWVLSLSAGAYNGGSWIDYLGVPVEALAVDGYSRRAAARSPSTIFGTAIQAAANKQMPLWLWEIGCAEALGAPGFKPRWYSDLVALCQASPAIAGVIFNTSADGCSGVVSPACTWSPNSSAASLTSFKTLANAPLFSETRL